MPPICHLYATIFHQYATNMSLICHQCVLNPSSSNRLPLSFSNYRWLLTLSPFLLLFCPCTFVLPFINTFPHLYHTMISLSRYISTSHSVSFSHSLPLSYSLTDSLTHSLSLSYSLSLCHSIPLKLPYPTQERRRRYRVWGII